MSQASGQVAGIISMSILNGLAVFLFALPSLAAPKPPVALKQATITEAPLRAERAQAKRIFIAGFSGSVTLVPTKSDDVTVRTVKMTEVENLNPVAQAEYLRQLVVKVTNMGETVEVRAQLPPDRGEWANWVAAKGAPQARLEILAPENMAVEIYWTHGDVKIPHWKAPVSITNQEGKISVESVVGDVSVRAMMGSVKINDIKGAVNVENFNASVNLSDVTGRVRMRTFSGDAHVKNITGNSYLSSQKAPLTVQDSQGSLEVVSGVAAIHIIDHKGALSGRTDAGSISAKIIGAVDTRLRSVSGSVTVSVPHDSQASVSLFSNKGQLNAPKVLESKTSPSGKSIHGSLSGGQAGSVRISSDSGDVTLKVL